jgi:putative transposase
MSEVTVRKTFKEKLRPTPVQEQALEEVLWRCRNLYNTALKQRITAWQRLRLSVSRYEQEAELKDIRAAFPDYATIHSRAWLAGCAGATGQDLSGILVEPHSRVLQL